MRRKSPRTAPRSWTSSTTPARPHMPPLFIWHNRYDKFVPAINPVMIEYGLPFELHIFQGGEHGMSVCNNLLVITPSSLF